MRVCLSLSHGSYIQHSRLLCLSLLLLLLLLYITIFLYYITILLYYYITILALSPKTFETFNLPWLRTFIAVTVAKVADAGAGADDVQVQRGGL